MIDPTSRLGKFAVHGGPGRPKGSKNRVTRMAEEFRSKMLELIAEEDYKFIRVLAEKSESGCLKSTALVIDLLRIVMPKHIIEEVDEEWGEDDFERTVLELEKHGFRRPNSAFRFGSLKKNQN